jgi:hypothetical protein
MRKPFILWAVAAVLVFYGSYTAYLAFVMGSVWFLAWSIPCFIGATGLVMHRSWSQYLVYLVAVCTALGWAAVVSMRAIQGWPYSDLSRTLLALAPGVALCALCVGASVAVRRHFKHAAAI